jgi:hypothetical protein
MADRFLCLVKNKPRTAAEIRRTRTMILRFNVDEWAEFEEKYGKFRRIISTPRPPLFTNGDGYEERDGKLYQVWTKR